MLSVCGLLRQNPPAEVGCKLSPGLAHLIFINVALFGGRNSYIFQEFATARTMRCSQQPTRRTHGQDSLPCSTTPRCAASRSGSRMSEWFIESLTEGSVVSQARTWAVCRFHNKLCLRVCVAILSSGGPLPRPTSSCLLVSLSCHMRGSRTIVPSVV